MTLLVLVLVIGHEKGQIAGAPGASGLQGGGGGGGGSAGRGLSEVTYYVTIAPPASEPTIEPIAVPEITPIAPLSVDVPPPPIMETPVAPLPNIALGTGGTGTGEGAGDGSGAGPGSGSGSGGGSGSGVGPGSGSGVGAGSGEGGTIRPPEPVAMLIPPMPPSDVRGKEIPIRLQVDEHGRVTGVRLLVPSGNSRYDRELRRTAEEWQFRPARDQNGRAIAYTFEYTVGL